MVGHQSRPRHKHRHRHSHRQKHKHRHRHRHKHRHSHGHSHGHCHSLIQAQTQDTRHNQTKTQGTDKTQAQDTDTRHKTRAHTQTQAQTQTQSQAQLYTCTGSPMRRHHCDDEKKARRDTDRRGPRLTLRQAIPQAQRSHIRQHQCIGATEALLSTDAVERRKNERKRSVKGDRKCLSQEESDIRTVVVSAVLCSRSVNDLSRCADGGTDAESDSAQRGEEEEKEEESDRSHICLFVVLSL